MSTHGSITLPAAAVDAVWTAFCAPDSDVDTEIADYARDEDGTAGKVAAVISEAIGSECPGASEVDECDGRVTLFVWGDGKLRDAMPTLQIVADHGGTGCIEAVGEDYSRWQWRLADGTVHEESGRTVYAGEVDTEGWIAHLQAPDDSCMDHVAVAPTEAAAYAQIAAWCRDDYQDHRCEVPVSGPPIDDDTDDETVIERWTTMLGGVKYRVMRVGALASTATG
ncbi:MAG: hypothetical protein WAX14_23130 [Rhodococcus sp. (in: high G+C Gram-positive bacteria)]|uniref:hypothetical protein n=1 Tax=Rhodococcus sp. TaxID=1831 RepID=UPI003BB6864A